MCAMIPIQELEGKLGSLTFEKINDYLKCKFWYCDKTDSIKYIK